MRIKNYRRRISAYNVDLLDASLERPLRRFEFQNHATRNDARLYQFFDLFARNCRDDLLVVQHASNVGQVD